MNHELISLLEHRESVIADHAWRDRDSSGHFEALKQVSEKISAWAATHNEQISPRLRHFIENASFAKALALLTEQNEE